MNVRAKFKVTEVTDAGDGMKMIRMRPVYGDSPENTQFFRWTPSGEIFMGVLNPAASAQFQMGHEYYVDFTRADPVEATII